jgi:uncharacterized membrane protein YebE (DUF533 family)
MDLNKVVNALSSSGAIGGFAGGMAGGALTGALMGKKGKKHAKTLLKVGGLAAVGGLAWKAYQTYQQGQPTSQTLPVPTGEGEFDIDAGNATPGSRGLLLVRAMIAAANSDGHLDGGERKRILARMQSLDLDAEEKALVVEELLHPCGQDQIVAEVVDQATAIEVYAVSALAIDATKAPGQVYLDRLASRLSLPPMLVEAVAAREPAGSDQAA